jgi:hypothetical protein
MEITSTAFFHEDDYNQIEIIPTENIFATAAAIETSNYKHEYSSPQEGFDEIYNRKDTLLPLKLLNIDIEEVKATLANNALKYYDKVETGYSSSKIPKDNCFAYGYENFIIFVTQENQIANNIWITYSPTIIQEDKFPNKLVITLLSIRSKWNVILVDWNEEVIVFLHNKAQVEEYFNIITDNKFS